MWRRIAVNRFATLGRNILPSSVLFRNVGNQLPSSAAPYTRRAESSITVPSKAKDILKLRSDNTFACVFSYPTQRFASMSKHVILTRNLVGMLVWSVCTEALFYARFKRFSPLRPLPISFTPSHFRFNAVWLVYLHLSIFLGILFFEIRLFKFTFTLSGTQLRRKTMPLFIILIFQNLCLKYRILLLNLSYLFWAR
jgi:hypothetical protein